MRRVALAVCILALASGLNPIFYKPMPCGSEPTWGQLLCEFGYFVSQGTAALLLLLELRKVYGPRYTMPGIILCAAKIGIEFFPLIGIPISGWVYSVLFLSIFVYVMILILKWETFRRA